MNRIGVVSDDLTSALESAGAFAEIGLESCVALDIESIAELLRVPCVAIDANTRVTGERTARSRIAAAIAAIGDRSIIVKTMDSTVRGHVSLEIEAALTASNRYVAIVAPAFPSEGRTTVGGCQYVDNVRVAETAFRNDPVWPVTQSDICEILQHGTFDLVESIGEPITANLSTRIGELDDGRKRAALVIDATTQGHLDRLCSLVERPELVVWVGSPGLLMALANRFRVDQQQVTVPAVRNTGPIIVAVGSVNPVSREQLSVLRSRKGTPAVVIDTARALEDPYCAAEEAIGTLSESDLTSEIIAVTTVPDGEKHGSRHLESTPSLGSGEIGRALSQAIGAAVLSLSRRLHAACYVITGGATALEVSRRLGAHSFTVIGMMEMGFPLQPSTAQQESSSRKPVGLVMPSS